MEIMDLAAMSGESVYRSPRPLELNEVLINGNADIKEVSPGKFEREGGYFRKRLLVGKARDVKPEEVNLGKSVSVVFLKIRRKLVERTQGGDIVRSTSEHTGVNDVVDMRDAEGNVESASAKWLREKHPGLRTVQIVYALLLGVNEPELVRISIKGASLGSDAKEKTTNSFYQYLGCFDRSEHIWEYETVLSAVLEEGSKSYFCMNFSKGRKLDDDMQAIAVETLKQVHAKCVELDAARVSRRGQPAPEADTLPAEVITGEQPAVGPDGIPF
jgi:hypothetical protein